MYVIQKKTPNLSKLYSKTQKPAVTAWTLSGLRVCGELITQIFNQLNLLFSIMGVIWDVSSPLNASLSIMSKIVLCIH